MPLLDERKVPDDHAAQHHAGCRTEHERANHAAIAQFDKDRIAAEPLGAGCNRWYLDKEGMLMSGPWSFARFAEVMQTGARRLRHGGVAA